LSCDHTWERDVVKEDWAHHTFCNPKKAMHVPGYPELKEACRLHQPSVEAWLDKVKREDHREAPRLCQQFESRVMIQGAVAILMREQPDLPIITIHDGFATIPDGVPLVLDAFIRAWAPEGIIPRFKIEPA
jgi:hypothetical protein